MLAGKDGASAALRTADAELEPEIAQLKVRINEAKDPEERFRIAGDRVLKAKKQVEKAEEELAAACKTEDEGASERMAASDKLIELQAKLKKCEKQWNEVWLLNMSAAPSSAFQPPGFSCRLHGDVRGDAVDCGPYQPGEICSYGDDVSGGCGTVPGTGDLAGGGQVGEGARASAARE